MSKRGGFKHGLNHRVEILTGEHRGKFGRIAVRYPGRSYYVCPENAQCGSDDTMYFAESELRSAPPSCALPRADGSHSR